MSSDRTPSPESTTSPVMFGTKKRWRVAKERGPEAVKEFWKFAKERRKMRKKETTLEKKKKQKEEWETLSPEEQEAVRKNASVVHETRRAEKKLHDELSAERMRSPLTPVLVFDVSFQDLMDTAGIRSTVSQLKISYSALRRHDFPLKPVLCGYGQELSSPFNLSAYEGFRKYPPRCDPRHWSELYPPSSIVYLTADSDNVLMTLEPSVAYVVGCFVDHNSKKGCTLDVAKQYKVRTARLPLPEHITIGNLCTVLTINHVVEVLAVFAETQDWKEAFQTVLPTRRV